jgi:CHASE3 domain sensor protein
MTKGTFILAVLIALTAMAISVMNRIDLQKNMDDLETMERRVDSLSDTLMELQREVHDDSYTYPFRDTP